MVSTNTTLCILPFRFARNGVHLVRDDGRPSVVLSPEQLVILAGLYGGSVVDTGALLGLPPDQRRNVSPRQFDRRTPAQRAALSRALRRLEQHGLIIRGQGPTPSRLTPLGRQYAEVLLPALRKQPGHYRVKGWVSKVASALASLESL